MKVAKYNGKKMTQEEIDTLFEEKKDARMIKVREELRDHLDTEEDDLIQLAKDFCSNNGYDDMDCEPLSQIVTRVYEDGDKDDYEQLIIAVIEEQPSDLNIWAKYDGYVLTEVESMIEEAEAWLTEVIDGVLDGSLDLDTTTQFADEYYELEAMVDLEDWALYYDEEYEDI